MKTEIIDGVPTPQFDEHIDSPSIWKTDANYQLRDYFAQRRCVNCVHYDFQEDGEVCVKIGMIFRDVPLSPKTHSCWAFEPATTTKAGG